MQSVSNSDPTFRPAHLSCCNPVSSFYRKLPIFDKIFVHGGPSNRGILRRSTTKCSAVPGQRFFLFFLWSIDPMCPPPVEPKTNFPSKGASGILERAEKKVWSSHHREQYNKEKCLSWIIFLTKGQTKTAGKYVLIWVVYNYKLPIKRNGFAWPFSWVPFLYIKHWLSVVYYYHKVCCHNLDNFFEVSYIWLHSDSWKNTP